MMTRELLSSDLVQKFAHVQKIWYEIRVNFFEEH